MKKCSFLAEKETLNFISFSIFNAFILLKKGNKIWVQIMFAYAGKTHLWNRVVSIRNYKAVEMAKGQS